MMNILVKAIPYLLFLSAHSVLSVPILAREDHGKEEKDSHWVNIWTAMPQLVEPANLPPVPFVRPYLLPGKAFMA
jgi:hypothetical protein